jgi:general secretion pathway protein G
MPLSTLSNGGKFRKERQKGQAGVTLLELMITMSLIMLLASISLPLVKMTSKRAKEMELRVKVREIRLAIDRFHDDWAREGDILSGPLCTKNKVTCKDISGVTGYPKSLDTLVGFKFSGDEAKVTEVEKETSRAKTKSLSNDAFSSFGKEMHAFEGDKMKPQKRYLRRLPLDPMTGTSEWGMRCFKDPADVQQWCKEDVFDVFSRSEATALDETNYRDW